MASACDIPQPDGTQVKNNTTVLCNLDTGEWTYLNKQSDKEDKSAFQSHVGAEIARRMHASGCIYFHDFGGVAANFLTGANRSYLAAPRRLRTRGAIFSFTPKNKIGKEGRDMAIAAKAAGFALLIITVQKSGDFGKEWNMTGILRHWHAEAAPVYYEDTHSVIDDIKAHPEAARLEAVHVKSNEGEFSGPEFDSRLKSRQYMDEVLAE